MILDEQDLRQGMKFIVGTWEPDYIVNAFSNDLAHIPASKFKSDDGRDFTALKFVFYEDHTVEMTDSSSGKSEKGEWEQTSYGEYRYTLNGFLDIPEGFLKENVEKLTVNENDLVFSLGFLAVALKKTAEGQITEVRDIGDREMSEADEAAVGIVGKYEVVEAMAFLGGEFKRFPKEEVKADLDKRLAAGEIDGEEVKDTMRTFDTVIEFTPGHKVRTWMPLPEGVSDAELREAVESGEILAVDGGMFAVEEKKWKSLDGKYYYDTGEHRESFGETLSSWDELKTDENGRVEYGSGMMMLKKI